MDENSQQRTPIPPGPSRRRRRSVAGRLFAAAFILVIIGLILREEVPAVADGIDRWLQPSVWQARMDCREAAYERLHQASTARLIRRGEVHRTSSGRLVDDVRIGALTPGRGETEWRFQCHMDEELRLLEVNGRPIGTSPQGPVPTLNPQDGAGGGTGRP